MAFVKSSDAKPLGGTVLDGISAEEKKQMRPTFTEKGPVVVSKKTTTNNKSVRFAQEVQVKEFETEKNEEHNREQEEEGYGERNLISTQKLKNDDLDEEEEHILHKRTFSESVGLLPVHFGKRGNA